MSQEDESRKLKDVEYYSAMVTAWFNTKLEHDKSLITLSTGGLGFIIAISSKILNSHPLFLAAYIVAIVSFLVCIASLLLIFKGNAKAIEGQIARSDPSQYIGKLKFLDKVASISFFVGVFLSSVLGILITLQPS
ncbi:MAG: hypothetical protein HQL51_05660 [Magnetococcales bacterium]|nr:hypothetical protein [Magnetococcales bacterium]